MLFHKIVKVDGYKISYNKELIQQFPNPVLFLFFLLLKDWIEQNERPVLDDGKGKRAKLFWLAAVTPSRKNATKRSKQTKGISTEYFLKSSSLILKSLHAEK